MTRRARYSPFLMTAVNIMLPTRTNQFEAEASSLAEDNDGMTVENLRIEVLDVFMALFDFNDVMHRVYPDIVSSLSMQPRVYPNTRMREKFLASITLLGQLTLTPV